MKNNKQNSTYEKEFSKFLNEDAYAFSFWKARIALFSILKAMDIECDDEVIMPGFTCFAVPNAVKLLGAKPIFVDNEKNSYHLDPIEIQKKITNKTKAILIQHTFGIPAKIEVIKEIAEQNRIFLIEDCAHTLSSKLNGKTLGLWGHAAFFSSQWSKSYTTGLGGIAIINDKEIGEKLNNVYSEMKFPTFSNQFKLLIQYFLFENFYKPRIYWYSQSILHFLSKLNLFLGSSSIDEMNGDLPFDHNLRMTNFQEKIGLTQLKYYYSDIDRRRKVTEFYDLELKKNGWDPAFRRGETIYLRYPLKVNNKEMLLTKAKRNRIELGSWFETPLHPIPLESHINYGYQIGSCPNAEKDSQQVVNLPLHKRVDIAEAKKIVSFFLKNAERVTS